MPTFWHVTDSRYDGGDLICWDRQIDLGMRSDADWKWRDAPVGTDGMLICLFPDTPEGRQQRDWYASDDVPDAQILRVEIDPDDDAIEWGHAEWEGYTAVVGSIPARCISVVATA
jgi:hypothetical protein